MPRKLLHVAVLLPEAWDQALPGAPGWGDLLLPAAPTDPKKQVSPLGAIHPSDQVNLSVKVPTSTTGYLEDWGDKNPKSGE